MNESKMYDQFSQEYDRFVDWEERLAVEIPFLSSELDSLRLNPNDSVVILDAACGTGQHVIALAEQGFKCIGADYSLGMVEIARRNAKKARKTIVFKQVGFGQLANAFGVDVFDGLICLGNSLPHILDEPTLLQTLADFQNVMRPGGKLVVQNRNFDKVMAEHSRWMPPQTHRDADNTWIYNRFYDFAADGRLTFNIQILESIDGNNFEQSVVSTKLWPLGKDSLTRYLLKVGFEDLKFYGDMEGSAFDITKSGNLVIIAKSAVSSTISGH